VAGDSGEIGDTLYRAMHKTSVYLTPEESHSLRLAAERTGRSQADLIREGVRLVATVSAAEGCLTALGTPRSCTARRPAADGDPPMTAPRRP
jgi:hypothetical protein